MTCIVGIETRGEVLIGGDSAGVGGYSLTIRADEKVFKTGEFLFGFTTSFRMGQALRYRMKPPRLPETDAEIDRYMVVEFIDAVRQCLKEAGFLRIESGVESGGVFLVGIRGRLYRIDSDYQVGRSRAGYDAVGCGSDLALGSLHATVGSSLSPEQRALKALEAAAEFSAGVAPPFVVVREGEQS